MLQGSSHGRIFSSYAYVEGGKVECLVGEAKEVKERFRCHRADDNRSESNKDVGLMFVVPLVIVAASVLFAPNGFVAVGVSAFALLAAFPVFALSLVGSGRQSEGAWSRYGASPGQQLPESKEPPKTPAGA